jgi:hypothetical protein
MKTWTGLDDRQYEVVELAKNTRMLFKSEIDICRHLCHARERVCANFECSDYAGDLRILRVLRRLDENEIRGDSNEEGSDA